LTGFQTYFIVKRQLRCTKQSFLGHSVYFEMAVTMTTESSKDGAATLSRMIFSGFVDYVTILS